MIWPAQRNPSSSALGFTSIGPAIGLASILFFTANAYRYGGGSFYVAYCVAMLAVGLPLLVQLYAAHADSAQPGAMLETRPFIVHAMWLMHATSFLILSLIIVVVAWAIPLFVTAAFATAPIPGDARAGFVSLVRGPWPLLALTFVWASALLLRDPAQRLPSWTVRATSLLLLCGLGALMIRGLSLPGGTDGLWQLFTPSAQVLRGATVWQGAIAQTFFTVALVFATAPSRERTIGATTGLFGRVIHTFSFKTAAAAALFPLLFVFAMDPPATTLASPLLALLQGTLAFPGPSSLFVIVWLGLIVITGLCSAMTLMTFLRTSLMQKLGMKSAHADAAIVLPGLLLSCLFVLPQPSGSAASPATGLVLIDGTYRWLFDFALPMAAVLLCIAVGWSPGARRVRHLWNETASLRLGRSFEMWMRWFAPALMLSAIAWASWNGIADRAESWRLASNRASQQNVAKLLLPGDASARIGLLGAGEAHEQIAIDREVVRKGDVVEITPPIGADSVYVTYQPATEFARTTSFATRGGPFLWEVQAAGLYLFETRDGSRRTVAVRFRHAPLLGLVILAAAIFACVMGGIASLLLRSRPTLKPYTHRVPNRIEDQHVGATV